MRKLLIAAAALAASGFAAGALAAPAQPTKPDSPSARDWRVPDPTNVLVIDTNQGRILVEMVPEVAPAHVQRVRELALERFYDGLTFFRVIEDFMAQTGDPKNDGTAGSTRPDLAQEFMFRRGPDTPFGSAADLTVAEAGFVRVLPVMTQSMALAPMTRDGKVGGYGLFCPGVLGMARAGDPNSANSQFFLMRADYPALERRYTAFGRVIQGQDVVRAIKTGEPVAAPQDRMDRVRLLSDLPQDQRPKVRVIDTAGAWFQSEIARVRAEKGAVFSACDVNIPVEVK